MWPSRKPPLNSLVSNRNGNVSIVFALSAVPMILVMGAAVDYTRSVTKRTSLQQATDATVLAVAHDLTQNLSSATVTADAQNYFAAAVGDKNAWIYSGPTISPDHTQVCLTARTTVPTMIMSAAAGAGMTPTTSVTVVANACAKINNTTYEIALALDNSGSMNESTSGTTKIASLQSASQQLLGIMDPAGSVPRASLSIVPFSSAVNIGPGYLGASFMDKAGASSIHWQNFQLPASQYNVPYTPASKFEFFTNIGTAWLGCVEERPQPYMTTDTAANSTIPDTLFVPYLWPDEGTSTYPLYKNLQPMNSYLGTSNSTCSNATYAAADAPGSTTTVTNTVANTLRGDTQTEVCKYKGQAMANANSAYGSAYKAGPNLLCSSRPVTTLTNDTAALTTAITAMSADGDTNLIGGFMWAWRTISPNGPFGTQPTVSVGNQNPKPYSTGANVKVIILMTDGYNHWGPSSGSTNGGAYSSLGYYANGRLGATNANNYRDLMDATTLQACTNAKAAGVQIYTVGFSIPSDPIDAAGLSLLQSCASQTSMAFIAQDGSSLISTFKTIATAMSGLRLVN